MLEQAMETVQRTLREFISINDKRRIVIYTKLFSHLVNSWVEVRLMKLIYEVGEFTDCQKTRIISRKSLEAKWASALDTAFCKAFNLSSPRKITSTIVPFTPRSQYAALSKIIKTDLLDSAEIRNRIAHGQWKYAFNEDMTKINGKLTGNLRKESILLLRCRLAMFKSLAQIIHDLAVSKPTFQRDFDVNFKRIEEQQRNVQTIDYAAYEQKLVLMKKRGTEKKKLYQNQT